MAIERGVFMKRVNIGVAILMAAALAAPSRAAIQVVNSEFPAPGDSFTNAGGVNTGHDFDGANSGWLYNNVRGGSVVGVNTTYPQSGNGSVFFSTNGGSKADVEFYSSPVANPAGNYDPAASAASILGPLSGLTSLSYEWYRDSASTNNAIQHPSLRLLVSNGSQTGYLVYEGAYNGQAVAPTNTWVGADLVGSNYNLWSTGSLPVNAPGEGQYTMTLSDWQAFLTGYSVIGVSSGVGSGWDGNFRGAVDNITFGFGTAPATTYNFEVQAAGVVPEPMTLVVWSLLGACGTAFTWRTRRRAAS
jgi:hypothetical protein